VRDDLLCGGERGAAAGVVEATKSRAALTNRASESLAGELSMVSPLM